MKSKQQKQVEALERKRKFLNVHREYWIKAMVALTPAIRARADNGDKEAVGLINRATECLKSFEVAAKEANVDLHGNPLFDIPTGTKLTFEKHGLNTQMLSSMQVLLK